MKKKILLAGGSGLIGQRLTEYFSDSDEFEFHILSRRKRNDTEHCKYFLWDTDKKNIDEAALEGVTVIINLAGAGVADKRWTEARKKEILESRTNSAETIHKYLNHFSKPPVYIGASASGYYGDNGGKERVESDGPGSGFLADVTKAWEDAHLKLSEDVDRMVLLRIGIVLSKKGGALKEMLKPTVAGMYGYFGNGKAYYPWIHIDDVCEIIYHSIIDDSYEGAINTNAPNPVDLKTLMQSLKKVKGGFGVLLPVPTLALKIAMGQMSEMLTNSAKLLPKKLELFDHKFHYPVIEMALKDILKRKI